MTQLKIIGKLVYQIFLIFIWYFFFQLMYYWIFTHLAIIFKIIITNSYSFLVTSYYNTSNLLQKYSASIFALSAVGIAITREGSNYPNYLLTD